jgi:hypothetical protein
MQVRQLLIATVLAASAVGAMSQEIDPGETLQARNLAAQPLRLPSHREAVVTEARSAEASGQVTGERVVATDAAPNISWAKFRATKPYAKTWLHGDRKQTRTVVAERG